jgi:hypothetical protein
MGCQWANQKEEVNDELTKNDDNLEGQENNNLEQKDEIFGLKSQEGNDPGNLRETHNENNDNFENHDNIENNGIGEEHEDEYNSQCEQIALKLDKVRDEFSLTEELQRKQQYGLSLIDSLQWKLFKKYLEEVNK